MDSKKIIESAHDNIKIDRDRLVTLYETIMQKMADTNDVISLAAVSEHLVKITDSLTKQNGQLVDLAKLKQKEELIKKPSSTISNTMNDDEIEKLLNEIDTH